MISTIMHGALVLVEPVLPENSVRVDKQGLARFASFGPTRYDSPSRDPN